MLQNTGIMMIIELTIKKHTKIFQVKTLKRNYKVVKNDIKSTIDYKLG